MKKKKAQYLKLLDIEFMTEKVKNHVFCHHDVKISSKS
jgi:hypothetical protein